MPDATPSAEPLDIALLAPLVSPIRQPYLGGAQALLRDLAVGLAARGHRVTLYATTGSDASILPGVALREVAVDATRVRPTDFAALAAAPAALAPLDPAVSQAFERAFDRIASQRPHPSLLHAHAYDAPAFTLAQRLGLPVAHTLHMAALDPIISRLLAALAPARAPCQLGQPWLATVSRACAATYRDACRIDTVIYNGLDLARIPYAPAVAPDAPALYAGRITPEKGVEDAIAIALAANIPLRIVGGAYDPDYFERRIAPLLAAHTDRLTYLGSQPRERVWELMAQARAVLVPSLWDEPFGLVACEAMATGTPVIGYDSGGLREVVADGVTGAITPRGAIAEAAAALRDVGRFRRADCHARVVRRFSLRATLSRYEALYWRMLSDAAR
jgi:glycosyltransferase involved in cell wall biosynthesis